ncbi:MAG: hypothetical protein LBR83_06345, partial [Clostridiales bacterium]|nr:hypothetical protein [Clostridiales bacterium]
MIYWFPRKARFDNEAPYIDRYFKSKPKPGVTAPMNPEMLTVIQYILHEHGEGVFENMSRVNAVLLDLAPGMTRERILARDFIEIDGYNALLSSGEDFPLIKNKLVHTLTDTFSVERSAAKWAVSLFSVALGLEDALYEMPAPSFAGTDSPFPADAPALPGELRRLPPFAIGKAHYLAAAADGTVFFHGKNDRFQCDVSTWRNIVA